MSLKKSYAEATAHLNPALEGIHEPTVSVHHAECTVLPESGVEFTRNTYRQEDVAGIESLQQNNARVEAAIQQVADAMKPSIDPVPTAAGYSAFVLDPAAGHDLNLAIATAAVTQATNAPESTAVAVLTDPADERIQALPEAIQSIVVKHLEDQNVRVVESVENLFTLIEARDVIKNSPKDGFGEG